VVGVGVTGGLDISVATNRGVVGIGRPFSDYFWARTLVERGQKFQAETLQLIAGIKIMGKKYQTKIY